MDIKHEIEIKEEPLDGMENDETSDQIYVMSGLQEISDGSCDPDIEFKSEIKVEEEKGSYDFQMVMDSRDFCGKHKCDKIPLDSETSESSDEDEVDIPFTRVLQLDEELGGKVEIGAPCSRTYSKGPSDTNYSDILQKPSTSHDDSEMQRPQTYDNAEAQTRQKKKTKRIYWREGVPEEPRVRQWKGTSIEPSPAKSPFQYFEYFFDRDLLEMIVRESNLFCTQKDPGKSLHLTVEEFEQFLGTVLYMSCAHLPRTRLYWSTKFRCSYVADVLSRTRWEEIKKYLHFNDNAKQLPRDHKRYDKLFKIRPFLDHLQRKVVQRVPTSEFLSFDEQMIPYKGHHPCLQYLHKKPKKWGYKVFVLTDCSGIVYNFEVYTGTIVKSEEFEDIGASGNIVLKLCSVVPRMQNYKLCFDKWFTSLNLVTELNKIGIQSLGTARQNKIPNISFPADKHMKRMGRRCMATFSADVDEAKITAVKYFDKRSVIFLTTYFPNPIIEEMKFERSEKKDVPVKVPEIVRVYNSYMGGVDNLDKMIALHRCNIESRKWYLIIFFHFIDVFCASSWFEYKRDSLANGIPEKKLLGLLDFKIEIAEYLCKGGKGVPRKRRRPSGSFEREYEEKKKKGPTKPIPCSSVRLDLLDHFPVCEDKQGRCKFPGCKGFTKFSCQKCRVNLCITKRTNCFFRFHHED